MKQLLTCIFLTTILVLTAVNDNEASAQSNDMNNNILDNLLNNSTTGTQSQSGSADTTHAENKSADLGNPSPNDTIGAGIGAKSNVPNQTPPNITSSINSVMSPKALLSSAIDQIRNSTFKAFNSSNQTAAARSTTVFLNPGVMQLANQNIPSKDFILIYYGDRNSIAYGKIYAKLPCDNNSKTMLQILVDNKSNQLLPINGLSRPGSTCMYSVDVSNSLSGPANANTRTNITGLQAQLNSIKAGLPAQLNSTKNQTGNLNSTAIELFNPTRHPVVLPSTSSVAVSLNLAYENAVRKGQ
jgi:hypothetical protein